MTEVDINAILAKYGCKKSKTTQQSTNTTHISNLSPSSLSINPISVNSRLLQNSEEKPQPAETQRLDIETNLPAGYFDKFEEEKVEKAENPFDNPINVQALSVLKEEALQTNASTGKPQQQAASESVDFESQIYEVRQDISALHRDMLDMRVKTDERLDKIEELVVMILKRTE